MRRHNMGNHCTWVPHVDLHRTVLSLRRVVAHRVCVQGTTSPILCGWPVARNSLRTIISLNFTKCNSFLSYLHEASSLPICYLETIKLYIVQGLGIMYSTLYLTRYLIYSTIFSTLKYGIPLQISDKETHNLVVRSRDT
jgi:hypothetical protein